MNENQKNEINKKWKNKLIIQQSYKVWNLPKYSGKCKGNGHFLHCQVLCYILSTRDIRMFRFTGGGCMYVQGNVTNGAHQLDEEKSRREKWNNIPSSFQYSDENLPATALLK